MTKILMMLAGIILFPFGLFLAILTALYEFLTVLFSELKDYFEVLKGK